MEKITIRNANAHNDFDFKSDDKIIIFNKIRGKRKHKTILSLKELANKFDFMNEFFMTSGVIKIVSLDITFNTFLFGEEKYIVKYIDDLRNKLKNKFAIEQYL